MRLSRPNTLSWQSIMAFAATLSGRDLCQMTVFGITTI